MLHDGRMDLVVEVAVEDVEFPLIDDYSNPEQGEQDQAPEALVLDLVHPIVDQEELLLQRPGIAEGEHLAVQERYVDLASQWIVHCFGVAAIVP